jgi:hypothetical protein
MHRPPRRGADPTHLTLRLLLVTLPGRRRVHTVAQITDGAGDPVWSAATTLCGRPAFADGLQYGLHQWCRACRGGDFTPWRDAPRALLDRIAAQRGHPLEVSHA